LKVEGFRRLFNTGEDGVFLGNQKLLFEDPGFIALADVKFRELSTFNLQPSTNL
jgi:hypothetical protein